MSSTEVRWGIFVPQGWRMDLMACGDAMAQGEAMMRVARAADAEPTIDSIWLYDHLQTFPAPSEESTFECWTTTAALARETRRVRIGQMATCTPFRNPALLARMASTVDVLSHGRLIVGLGAGWNTAEAGAYGIPFPDTGTRMAMFGEACEILLRLWTEDEPHVAGQYFSLHGPVERPRPVQQPHPPLWIAGGGERVTLRLVARRGDGCNVGGGVPSVIRHKLDILRRHCDQVGREYESITRSTTVEELYTVEHEHQVAAARDRLAAQLPAALAAVQQVDTVERHAVRLAQMIGAGLDYLLVYVRNVATEPEQLDLFARHIIPRVIASS